ncbi:Poly [ADP-ribose] polymerase 1 [Trichoplax sp. H2]|nr:Poly [ADP-ribose] polymerase 1 [Trichoplax sp. H2]|eukprot:RDD42997.1 Poly [ADP-ribose] polymerase 1 [Trichoplax sp. H2]
MTESEFSVKAQYSKSNRSICKICHKKIGKGSLRLALSDMTLVWNHCGCFFKKYTLPNVEEIDGFATLRLEDQEKIRKYIAADIENAASEYVEETEHLDQDQDDLLISYVQKDCEKCTKCQQDIHQGELYVGRTSYKPQNGSMSAPSNTTDFYHPQCFRSACNTLKIENSIESIKGFYNLNKIDQSKLAELLRSDVSIRKLFIDIYFNTCQHRGVTNGKDKRKQDTDDDQVSKKPKVDKEIYKRMTLKEQTELLWNIYDNLRRECTREVMEKMLLFNKQYAPVDETTLYRCCVDGMAFGALKCCPVCTEGQLYFDYKIQCYTCLRAGDDSSCQYTTQKPERIPWKIPEERYIQSSFLKQFKFEPYERIFFNAGTTNQTGLKVRSWTILRKDIIKKKPLANFHFAIIGNSNQNQMKKEIEEFGGKIDEKISRNTDLCISSHVEMIRNKDKVQQAQALNLPVVNESFITAVTNGDLKNVAMKHNIASWTDGKGINIKRDASDQVSTSIIKVMEKTTVDPLSRLDDGYHIIADANGNIYSTVLEAKHDTSDICSFYKIQALERHDSLICCLIVITNIKHQLNDKIDVIVEDGYSKEEVKMAFDEKYFELTGNRFETSVNFKKKAGKMYPLDTTNIYAKDQEIQKYNQIIKTKSNKLESNVTKLMKLIFDIKLMKNAIIDFKIDVDKNSIGDLTKQRIEDASQWLDTLETMVLEKEKKREIKKAKNEFTNLIALDLDLSSNFYHDNVNIIRATKYDLEDLLDIVFTYNLMKQVIYVMKDPLHMLYKSLKTDIEPLQHESNTFKIIRKYAENSRNHPYSNYFKLKIEEVFKINRHDDDEKFQSHSSYSNRMLLWHGSRTVNSASLLSRGMRFYPPKTSSKRSYMYGKGVYLTDIMWKSAMQCQASFAYPTGLLLLCEVALGSMHELKNYKDMARPVLPKNTHSFKRIGDVAPDPSGNHVLENGIIVPLGEIKGVETGTKCNEYVVYDVRQVRIRYMVQVKFNFTDVSLD